MEQVFTHVAALVTVIILIPFYRVLKGPTVFDRLLGAGAIGAKTMVIICLIGFIYKRVDMFVDITLAYAVLNFIGIIAVSKYFESQDEQEE
ncbi:MAG: pH regulation protein F [Ignavibacteriales bacterium]|jgi:multicomponent Na+:H+ antiporter subunit F|nr:pH regulation protein F [Ignavibacteriales bacterium]